MENKKHQKVLGERKREKKNRPKQERKSTIPFHSWFAVSGGQIVLAWCELLTNF